MKKMKTRTKLAGAVTALVVAVALSAGTTFAWFTTSNLVSVNTISANVVSSSGGLEIAPGLDKDSGFSSTLTVNEDLIGKVDELEALSPSTVSGASINDNVLTLGGSISLYDRAGSEGTSSQTKDKDNNSYVGGNYIEFSFSLRSTSALTVNLGAEAAVSTNDSTSASAYSVSAITDLTANQYGTHNKVTAGNPIAAEAANAARVSFEVSAHTSGGSLTSTDRTVAVWSPHEAEYNGKLATANTTNKGLGFWKGTLSSDYEQSLLTNNLITIEQLSTAVWGNTTTWTSSTQAEYTQTGYSEYVTPIESNTATSSTSASKIVTLTANSTAPDGYYYANVTVKIWIEGTDGDCFNSIFAQTLNVELQLVGIND